LAVLTGLSSLVDRLGLVCFANLDDSSGLVDLVRLVVLADSFGLVDLVCLAGLADSFGLVDPVCLADLADLANSDGLCFPLFDSSLEALAAFPPAAFLFDGFGPALTGLLLMSFVAFGGEEIGTERLTGSFSGAADALSGAAPEGATLCSIFSSFSSFSSFFTCFQEPPRSSERNNPWLVPA